MKTLQHKKPCTAKKIEKKFLNFSCNIQKKRIFAADNDAQWCNWQHD